MMEEMRKRREEAAKQQAEGGQPAQASQNRPRMQRPQRTPEQEAERLKVSLDGIAKSAEYLSAAKFVK